MMMIRTVILVAAAASLSGCGGGSPDDRASPTSANQLGSLTPQASAGAEQPASQTDATPPFNINPANTLNDASSAVASAVTRVTDADGNLYVKDAGNVWRKYEGGKWTVVPGPPP
jgi:hypothetical protein